MAEQRITIIIDENGKIKAETSGIKGEVCLDELQEILEGQGDLLSVKKTDEYHQKQVVKVKTTLKNKRG